MIFSQRTTHSLIKSFAFGALALLTSACANEPAITPTDAGADTGSDANIDPPCNGPPGLYVPGSCRELAEGVRAYHPKYQLWADSATKERFLYLPDGAIIDTSDPDGWVFPVGTKLFKTFSLGTMRIETRILEKVADDIGPSAWTMRVYAWNASQDGVSEALDGVENALGTEHDIPTPVLCERCHQGAHDVGLGVAAIQLNHMSDGVTLASLASEGRLSHPIASTDATVPGDATASDALGYLHANCAHCHGRVAAQADLEMYLRVGETSVESTRTYMTAVGVPSGWAHEGVTARIVPSNPDASAISVRMSARDDGAMPPIATEDVDDEGLNLVRAWISSLD